MPTIAIIGSRDFLDHQAIYDQVSRIPNDGTWTVISGGARGVDRLAIQWATARGLKTREIPADWQGKGKSAGFQRNSDIVAQADHMIAFWDGTSSGTRDAIRKAIAKGIKPRVITKALTAQQQEIADRQARDAQIIATSDRRPADEPNWDTSSEEAEIRRQKERDGWDIRNYRISCKGWRTGQHWGHTGSPYGSWEPIVRWRIDEGTHQWERRPVAYQFAMDTWVDPDPGDYEGIEGGQQA